MRLMDKVNRALAKQELKVNHKSAPTLEVKADITIQHYNAPLYITIKVSSTEETITIWETCNKVIGQTYPLDKWEGESEWDARELVRLKEMREAVQPYLNTILER